MEKFILLLRVVLDVDGMARNRFLKKVVEMIECVRSQSQASILGRRIGTEVPRGGTIRFPIGDEQNMSTVRIQWVSMWLVYVNKAGHFLTDVSMDGVLPE